MYVRMYVCTYVCMYDMFVFIMCMFVRACVIVYTHVCTGRISLCVYMSARCIMFVCVFLYLI